MHSLQYRNTIFVSGIQMLLLCNVFMKHFVEAVLHWHLFLKCKFDTVASLRIVLFLPATNIHTIRFVSMDCGVFMEACSPGPSPSSSGKLSSEKLVNQWTHSGPHHPLTGTNLYCLDENSVVPHSDPAPLQGGNSHHLCDRPLLHLPRLGCSLWHLQFTGRWTSFSNSKYATEWKWNGWSRFNHLCLSTNHVQ